MENQNQYKKQLRISVLELLGGVPSLILLIISFINTGTTIVLMDVIDSAGNVFRNAIVLFISVFLFKDLRYAYNYGVGKIEASSTLVCDIIMVISLLITVGIAIKDFIYPHSPGEFLIYVIVLKVLYVLCDAFLTWREWRLMKQSDSLVFRTKFAAGVKNTLLDSVTLVALVVMHIFRDASWTNYISPAVSLALGVYLIYNTIGRIIESFKIILDRTADENYQVLIMQSLASVYNDYEDFREVRSHSSGGVLYVDLNLGFDDGTDYKKLQSVADKVYEELSKKVPKCEVALTIPAQKKGAD